MFVHGHVYARAAERDTFHAQAELLLRSVFSRQLDGTPGAHHAVPWQSWNPIQHPHHLPRRPWPSGSGGHRSIA